MITDRQVYRFRCVGVCLVSLHAISLSVRLPYVAGACMNCIWNVTTVHKAGCCCDRICKKLQRLSVTLVYSALSAMSWTWGAIYLATGIPGDHLEQKPLVDIACCFTVGTWEYALHAFIHASCHEVYATDVRYLHIWLLNFYDHPD